MKILDFNDRFVLASSAEGQKTFLFRSPGLEKVSQCMGGYRIGSLQYSTGIGALGTSSQVRFHDFIYNRKLQQIETVLKLQTLKLLKNLLFCISAERILIYDLATKSNLCHIPTSNGNLTTLSSDYYNLKLLYQVSENVYHEQEIWKNRTKKIECSPCSIIRYDRTGDILCLAQENVIALYENQEIIRGCSFEDNIVDVIPSTSVPHKFYVKTSQKDNQDKILYIEVSLANKLYLKVQQLIGQTEITCEKELCFQHKGALIVWRGDKVYRAEIDLEPKLGNAKTEWEKEKNCELRVSNVQMEEHNEEEQRREAEYLKQIEKQILAQEEEQKLSLSRRLEQQKQKQTQKQIKSQQKKQQSSTNNQNQGQPTEKSLQKQKANK